MRLVALPVVLAAIAIASSAMIGVETPEPTAPVVTETPVATDTPAATETSAAPAATPVAEASPPPAFTLSGRLVVDANGNGAEDDADTKPAQVYLVLVPWSTAHRLLDPDPASDISGLDVPLYSAPDGSFSFENVPVDAYTLLVHWPFGFETKGAVSTAPFTWRAAFRITETGEIVVPEPLPEHWPGSLEPLDPNEPFLGAPPIPILLKRIEDPNVSTVPVFAIGPEGPPPVGRVDVAAVLQRRSEGAVELPPAGVSPAPRDSWARYGMLAGAAVAALAVSALLIRRRRA